MGRVLQAGWATETLLQTGSMDLPPSDSDVRREMGKLAFCEIPDSILSRSIMVGKNWTKKGA